MRYALLAFLVPVIACGPRWARTELGVPATLPEQQQVEVWTADGATHLLHAVTVDSLSVTGVPSSRSRTCDGCRVVVSRSTIDSLRLGDMTGGIARPFVTVMALLTVSQMLFGPW